MTDDIYQAPSSDLERPFDGGGSSARAILYGTLIAIVGTLAGGLVFGILYGFYLGSSGMSAEDIQLSMESFSFFSPEGLLLLAAVLPFSIWAGFVCARKSVARVYRDTTIMFVIAWLISTALSRSEQFPLIEEVFTTLVSLAATFLGAYLGNRRYKIAAGTAV